MIQYPANYRLLDSWRGWAALWVVLYHGYNMFAEQKNFVSENLPFFEPIATSGWFGVHFFFVISGYCIAANLSAALRKNRSAGKFLRDRLLRIFPVYWCALVAQILLRIASSPFNHVSWRESLPGGPLETLASLLLLEPYLGLASLLLVSWSLVYEWGFYVIMAAALFFLKKCPYRGAAFAGAIGLAMVGLLGFHSSILLPLKFWPEFMLGVCVFSFFQADRIHTRAWLLAPFFLFPMFLWFREGFTERTEMMAGASGFGLLLCILRRWDEPLASWRPVRWLQKIGLFSYSLYLVHVPFGGAFRNLCLRFISETSFGFFAVQISYVVVCLMVGYIFYRCVEAPWEKFRKSKFC
jgi:peptidoglycan/LPS O-acetylase OafA/YrhL